MRHITFIPTGEDQWMGKISSKQQKLEGKNYQCHLSSHKSCSNRIFMLLPSSPQWLTVNICSSGCWERKACSAEVTWGEHGALARVGSAWDENASHPSTINIAREGGQPHDNRAGCDLGGSDKHPTLQQFTSGSKQWGSRRWPSNVSN